MLTLHAHAHTHTRVLFHHVDFRSDLPRFGLPPEPHLPHRRLYVPARTPAIYTRTSHTTPHLFHRSFLLPLRTLHCRCRILPADPRLQFVRVHGYTVPALLPLRLRSHRSWTGLPHVPGCLYALHVCPFYLPARTSPALRFTLLTRSRCILRTHRTSSTTRTFLAHHLFHRAYLPLLPALLLPYCLPPLPHLTAHIARLALARVWVLWFAHCALPRYLCMGSLHSGILTAPRTPRAAYIARWLSPFTYCRTCRIAR